MGAPKGNKYAIGNKGGRPLKFKTVKEMQVKIDEYFKSCHRKIYILKTGEFLQDPETDEYIYERFKAFTISGLCYCLDIDTETLTNYGKKEEFFETIMRARRKIKAFKHEALYTKEMGKGAEFDFACNDGWKKTDKIEHSGNLIIEEIKYTK